MPSPFPNPPVPVEVLIAPMTPAIVLQTIVTSLVSLGIRADLWPKEGVLVSCMTSVANFISGGINDRIAATKAGWLPTSSGPWLEWLSVFMYGVFKVKATFATGALTLTNSEGGVFNIAPFTATFANTITKKTYTNLTAIALAAGPSSQTINVQANEQGTASNANPGDLSTIVTTMLGVTCTNLAPVLGIDDQTDASLKLQCWNAIAANSPFGPAQSIGYAVQTAVNSISFLPVNVNRYAIAPSSHTGQELVTVASPSGVAIASDVAGVLNNINAIARPQGVQVTVQSAAVVNYPNVLTVYVTSTPGLVAATVQTAIQTALTAFFAVYPIGGRTGPPGPGVTQGLFKSAIEGVCTAAWPPRPTDPTVAWTSSVFDIVGATDLALTSGQVAANLTTVVVVLVQP